MGPRLIAFIGGTIGNFRPDERRELLGTIARELGPGGHLLLGTDLVKDRAVLEAAYNDARGISAQFNRNILTVLNRELGANFDPQAFDYVASLRRASTSGSTCACARARRRTSRCRRSGWRCTSTRARRSAPRSARSSRRSARGATCAPPASSRSRGTPTRGSGSR